MIVKEIQIIVLLLEQLFDFRTDINLRYFSLPIVLTGEISLFIRVLVNIIYQLEAAGLFTIFLQRLLLRLYKNRDLDIPRI